MNILNKLAESKIKIMESKLKDEERLNRIRRYEEVYGFNLSEKQLEVLESDKEILELTFVRREGCSTAAMIKAIEYAINNPGANVALINPNNATVNIRFNELRNMLSNEHFIEHASIMSSSFRQAHFLNGSCINLFNSNTRSMIGKRVDCLIVDGKRYISNDMLNTAIMCTCHNPNRQIILLDQIEPNIY